MGGKNRKLEVRYKREKENNKKLKSGGKSRKIKVITTRLDEERGEERMRLYRYDRKDGTVIKDLKVIEGSE